jgi:hypothetical protein
MSCLVLMLSLTFELAPKALHFMVITSFVLFSIALIIFYRKSFNLNDFVNYLPPLVYSLPLFPAFNYIAGDKDPGVYVNLSRWFTENGSIFINYSVPSWLMQIRFDLSGALLPGLWETDTQKNLYQSQFPEFWSICMSVFSILTSHDLGYFLVTVVGVACIVSFFQILLKLTSPLFANLGTIFFALNLVILWQFKFPSTESMSLLLILLILHEFLENTETLSARIIPLIAITFCNRIDGLFVVLLVLPFALRKIEYKRDLGNLFYTLSGGVILVYGTFQAFILHPRYTQENFIISLPAKLSLAVFLITYSLIITNARFRTWIRIKENWFFITISIVTLISLRNIQLYFSRIDPLRIGVAEDLEILPILFQFTLWIIPLIAFVYFVVFGFKFPIGLQNFILLLLPLISLQLLASGVASRLMWWTRRYAWLLVPIIIIVGVYGIYRISLRNYVASIALIGIALAMSGPMVSNLFLYEEFDGFEKQFNSISQNIPKNDWILINKNDCCMGPSWTVAMPLLLAEKRNVLVIDGAKLDTTVAYIDGNSFARSKTSFILDKPHVGLRCRNFSTRVKRWVESFPKIPTKWRWVDNPAYLCVPNP